MPTDGKCSLDGSSGLSEPLFDGDYARQFDVFPDGEHFAMVTLTDADLRELEIVVNWSTELTPVR